MKDKIEIYNLKTKNLQKNYSARKILKSKFLREIILRKNSRKIIISGKMFEKQLKYNSSIEIKRFAKKIFRKQFHRIFFLKH